MSAENRNSEDVLKTARLFTAGESIAEIQVRLDNARELAELEDVTPRSAGSKETRKMRRWWVRAFEQILSEQMPVS